jgi:hypothetical protein
MRVIVECIGFVSTAGKKCLTLLYFVKVLKGHFHRLPGQGVWSHLGSRAWRQSGY